MNIIQSPSPNFGSRNGYTPEMIVVHCTDGNFPYDMQYLQNPNPGSVVGPVSAHFVIAPNGDAHQLVNANDAAWHAGRIDHPTALLKKNADGTYINPNEYSIGIETSMISTDQPTEAQVMCLRELIASLCQEFSIPADRAHIVGHHEIFSPKTCPGTIDVSSLLPQTPAEAVQSALPVVQEAITESNTLPEPQKTLLQKAIANFLAYLMSILR